MYHYKLFNQNASAEKLEGVEEMTSRETTSWQTIGFKTGKRIHVIESVKTGNILEAFYINNGEWLTADEIELELF